MTAFSFPFLPNLPETFAEIVFFSARSFNFPLSNVWFNLSEIFPVSGFRPSRIRTRLQSPGRQTRSRRIIRSAPILRGRFHSCRQRCESINNENCDETRDRDWSRLVVCNLSGSPRVIHRSSIDGFSERTRRSLHLRGMEKNWRF